MDAIGLILFFGAVTSLLLVLTWGGQLYLWNNPKIIGLFVSFGVLTLILCWWFNKQGDLALIPLKVLKKRSVYVGAVTLLGFGILSIGVSIFPPSANCGAN